MQVHQRSLESFEDNNSNPFFVGRDKILHFFAKYLNKVTLHFSKYIEIVILIHQKYFVDYDT